MFINRFKIHLYNLFSSIQKPTYYKVIIYNLIRLFCTSFIVLFVVIFAKTFLNIEKNYNLTQSIFIDVYKTIKILSTNINIVLVIVFILFFNFCKNHFNLFVLGSFGISYKQLLKPITFFCVLIFTLKTLILYPVYVEMENYKIQNFDNNTHSYNYFLQSGKHFKIIDYYENNDFKIILGNYIYNNDDLVKIENAIIVDYKHNKPIYAYITDNVWCENYICKLKNTNIISMTNGNKTYKKNVNLKTKLTIDEIVLQIIKDNKDEQQLMLHFYDYVKFLFHYNILKEKNDIYFQTRTYFINEIINLFNIILCCLLSFFLFFNQKGSFFMKSIIYILVYFIILRFFHSIETIKEISILASIYICIFSILLCLFFYYLIINNFLYKTKI